MVKVAVVGCTGKLGKTIIKRSEKRDEVEVAYAIARSGNAFVGKKMSELKENGSELLIIDDVDLATNCDVIIDCTNAEAFIHTNYEKYKRLKKPLIIATTAFEEDDYKLIMELSTLFPVFITGNFSVALRNFISTIKFAAERISDNTDIQIIEYHHNQKTDAPSGTALMIKNAILEVNHSIQADKIKIFSVRGGNIMGEHEVLFANCNDEVVRFVHRVYSRDAFADGALDVALWMAQNPSKGLYNMDDYCK